MKAGSQVNTYWVGTSHLMSCSRCHGTIQSGSLLLWSVRSNNDVTKPTKIVTFSLYWLFGNKVKGAEHEADLSTLPFPSPPADHFPGQRWPSQLLNPPQQALPTANNNSSVSAHENLIQSYLIFDRHTYCLPILFYFWFFLIICWKMWNSLILAVLEENSKRERCGCPLGGVWKGILKNTGIRASLVHSPGNNLTWKLSLQVVEPGPAVQTFSFSSNIFLTLMFSGRVWSFNNCDQCLTNGTHVLWTLSSIQGVAGHLLF